MMRKNQKIGVALLCAVPVLLIGVNFIDVPGLSIAAWVLAFGLIIGAAWMFTKTRQIEN